MHCEYEKNVAAFSHDKINQKQSEMGVARPAQQCRPIANVAKSTPVK